MTLGAVSGARCARHPDAAAAGICDRCGNFFCPACAGRVEGSRSYCTTCGSGVAYVAWEDRERLGTVSAFVGTIKRSVLSPLEFAREIPAEGGFGAPTGFAAIASVIGVGVLCLFFGVVLTIFFAAMQDAPGARQEIPLWVFPIGAFGYWIFGVASSLGWLYVWAGILKLSARLLGAPTGSYEAIFRILAYSAGTNVAMGIPLLSTLAQVLSVLHAIFGISAKCGVSGGRAAAIFFVPVGICVCLFVGSYVALFASLLTLAGKPM